MARMVGEGGGGGEGEEEMEASIWGRLPDELLERVLALLPLRALVSLRRTCRRFRSLLLTPAFLSLLPNPKSSSSSSSSSSFLLLSHPQFPPHLLPLYDPSSDSWRRACLSPSPSLSPAPRLLCSSSSSGLLCFATTSSSSACCSSLLVHNPLTNATRLLPPPPESTMDVAGATLVSPRIPRPHGYKLFVPAHDSGRVFLYDSEAESWAQLPGLDAPLLLARSGALRREGALFRGALFFAAPEPPCSVVSFDLRSGSWSAPGAAAPPLPAGLAFARLVGAGAGAGDRLFLVGGVGGDGITRSVRVWELHGVDNGGVNGGAGWGWEEVGRLPEMMCRKLVGVCYHNYAHVYCAWHGGGAGPAGAGGLVCVCCATWPEVLAFRVGRATWHWLPRCPLLRDKWSCGFRWFSFAPDLYALV